MPFSPQKSSEQEVEAAALFAVAELQRSRGGGLISRQPEERLTFLSKVGYPLWVYPKNDVAFVFDGLDDSTVSVSYFELPSAKAFLENLANVNTRESYLEFLSNYNNFFQQPMNQKQFTLKGLIADHTFRGEFIGYRREATEVGTASSVALLLPTLIEPKIQAMLSELDSVLLAMRDNAQRLPECIRLVNRTTGQYMTELDYESSAAAEEINAKIRAQEQITAPQIAKLNKDYKHKIADITISFDDELESLEKLKTRTQNYIAENEKKTRQYDREAKAHAKKGHVIYEKRWKDKIKRTQKELGSLNKELKKAEDNIKKVLNQKRVKVSELYAQLDAEVKLVREPLVQLQIMRNVKLLTFKRETERLLASEKPVIEGLSQSIRLREAVNANFEALSIKETQLKTPSLFYVPFYAVCYEAGLSRRYAVVAPSAFNQVDFSARVKGAFGMSKTKEMLTPRFKAITEIVGKVEAFAKNNSIFETQLGGLGERNNLLKNRSFVENVSKGLVYLEREGWLSEKETQLLKSRLTS